MINPIFFKNEFVKIRAQYLHPQLVTIAEDMISWLATKNIAPVITDTVSTLLEDNKLKRQSSTHREGRAIDLRTKDWPPALIKEFEFVFNKKYGHLGAIVMKDKKTPTNVFLLHHDSGHGDHFHVQLNRKFAMVMPNILEPVPQPTIKLPSKA